jgi:hypothetical protein
MMNKPEGHPHTEEYCNLLAQINQAPDGRSRRVVRCGIDGVLIRKALDLDEVSHTSRQGEL